MTWTDPPTHPAKYTNVILAIISDMLAGHEPIIDNFAGTGLIHTIPGFTVGVEIELEWAKVRRGTIVGDALALPFADATFEAAATSPTYANRMADHHNAKDPSKRNTYRHSLGRPLHDNNSGKLQWGAAYKIFHGHAWTELHRVLKPRSPFVLNISDHIRKGEVVEVSEWHVRLLESIGFTLAQRIEVPTPRNRFGANGNLRVEYENIFLFERN